MSVGTLGHPVMVENSNVKHFMKHSLPHDFLVTTTVLQYSHATVVYIYGNYMKIRAIT